VLRRFPSKKSPNLCSPDSYPYRMGNFSVKWLFTGERKQQGCS
jgi:hypothetical protein